MSFCVCFCVFSLCHFLVCSGFWLPPFFLSSNWSHIRIDFIILCTFMPYWLIPEVKINELYKMLSCICCSLIIHRRMMNILLDCIHNGNLVNYIVNSSLTMMLNLNMEPSSFINVLDLWMTFNKYKCNSILYYYVSLLRVNIVPIDSLLFTKLKDFLIIDNKDIVRNQFLICRIWRNGKWIKNSFSWKLFLMIEYNRLC